MEQKRSFPLPHSILTTMARILADLLNHGFLQTPSANHPPSASAWHPSEPLPHLPPSIPPFQPHQIRWEHLRSQPLLVIRWEGDPLPTPWMVDPHRSIRSRELLQKALHLPCRPYPASPPLSPLPRHRLSWVLTMTFS